MNFRDYLTVADELSDADSEAHWRSAISRGYYAAFHVTKRLFQDVGFVVPRKEVHAYLSRRLSNCGHPEVIDVARTLGELRDWRAAADYDAEPAVTRAAAFRTVARASDVIRLLEEVAANDSVRDRVTQAMRDYERDVLKEVTWRGPAK
jgi:uncharacterized protein (UPF0332 family)